MNFQKEITYCDIPSAILSVFQRPSKRLCFVENFIVIQIMNNDSTNESNLIFITG